MRINPQWTLFFIIRQAIILFVMGGLLWCGGQPVNAQDDSGRIAFVSDRDGSPKVYTMLLDGSDIQLFGDGILEEGGFIASLSISPDGTQAAFISRKNRDGIYPTDELFRLDIASWDVTPLTHNTFDKASPLWLSDDTIIYLSGGVRSDHAEVALLTLGTEPPQVIVAGTAIGYNLEQDLGVSIRAIDLAPDQQRMVLEVFTSLPDAYSILVILNTDGTNMRRLTPNEVFGFNPVWGMDSETVYFGCGFDEYHEICQLNTQTNEAPQIMTDFRNALPDERKHYVGGIDVTADNRIVFQFFLSDNLYLLDPTDGSITNLTPENTSENRLLGWIREPVSAAE